jgi:hypothetical protein
MGHFRNGALMLMQSRANIIGPESMLSGTPAMWQLICFIVNEQTDKFGYREMMGYVPAEHPHQTVY